MDKTTPIILVFHIDRETISRKEIIQPFITSVGDVIEKKNANIITFFMPTDGEERIECLNPVMYQEGDLVKLNNLIAEISKQFDIGQGGDVGKDNTSNEVDITND